MFNFYGRVKLVDQNCVKVVETKKKVQLEFDDSFMVTIPCGELTALLF